MKRGLKTKGFASVQSMVRNGKPAGVLADYPHLWRAVKSRLRKPKSTYPRRPKPIPTRTEEYLWSLLKDKQTGYFWRQQARLLYYFADFYCPKLKIALEVDGICHVGREDYDSIRDHSIKRLLDVRTIRISNIRAREFNAESLKAWVKAVCAS